MPSMFPSMGSPFQDITFPRSSPMPASPSPLHLISPDVPVSYCRQNWKVTKEVLETVAELSVDDVHNANDDLVRLSSSLNGTYCTLVAEALEKAFDATAAPTGNKPAYHSVNTPASHQLPRRCQCRHTRSIFMMRRGWQSRDQGISVGECCHFGVSLLEWLCGNLCLPCMYTA